MLDVLALEKLVNILLNSSFVLIATGAMGKMLILGSVISFKNEAVLKKENGLLFCYICDHQIDPQAKAVKSQRLDDLQTLVGFDCTSCHFTNYFPISPFDLKRALFGRLPYGTAAKQMAEKGMALGQKGKIEK
jgi:hypothetical protein